MQSMGVGENIFMDLLRDQITSPTPTANKCVQAETLQRCKEMKLEVGYSHMKMQK